MCQYPPDTEFSRLARIKQSSHVDYCTVRGMVFGIAIYRNDQLLKSVRGPDDLEYCVTVAVADLEPFPG